MRTWEEFMGIAIKEALKGKKESEPPFGGIIADKSGKIIAKSHDTVVKDHDMSSHSETNLVKIASSKIGPDLSGCTVICTCEPCPMCFTAMWLAKVSTVVFGSYISDVLKLVGNRQRELNVSAEFMNRKSGMQIKLIKGVLREECIKLWSENNHSGNW